MIGLKFSGRMESISALLAALAATSCGRPAPNVAPSPSPPDTRIPMSGMVTLEQLGADLEGMLSPDADKASLAGAGQLQVLASGAGTEGDSLGGFVRIDPEECILAIARGTRRIDDLDLLAFDDAGTSLVADQSVGPAPTVMVCPPHPSRVYVTARIATGSGLLAVGVQAVPKDRSAAVASRMGARMSGLADDHATREAWSGLDARVESHRRLLGGRWEEVRRVSAPVSQRAPTYLSVPLPASRCLDLYVMPDEETRNLDVTVQDETGREVARADAVGDERVALLCTPSDTTLTISLRPHQGFGFAAVVMSRSTPGIEGDMAVRGNARRVAAMQSLPDNRTRLGTALSATGYEKPRTAAEGTFASGRTESFKLQVASGCSRVDLLVGAPAAGIHGTLWDSDNELVATADGGERATLFACTPGAREVTLDVQGIGRPAAFAVEVRRERLSDPEFPKHPLAAGRLLSRATLAGLSDSLPASMTVRALPVTDTKRATYDASVPPNSCIDFLGALDSGATGITLRLVDSGTGGAELEAGTGASTVAVRACAESAPLSLRATYSVHHGASVVLAAEMPVSPPHTRP